ncbi:TPA: PIN domain-containing protein [Legionella pneumophila]|nr:PIN domain-containing protein [Legionella pneumophila]HCX3250725.1 PIN domain-containing protein [Legionella pneumophila]
MTNFTVLYDSCVLYPFILRDLLMELALHDLFRAKWTNKIHDEWIRSLLKNKPELEKAQLLRVKELMDSHVLDALVENYEALEAALNLPDPNDNHVLAAAIVSSSDVIVTYNLKDFPAEELEKYNIEAQHPDIFLMHLTELNEEKFLFAVKQARRRLRNPPKSIDEYLDILYNRDLKETSKFLQAHQKFL